MFRFKPKKRIENFFLGGLEKEPSRKKKSEKKSEK